MMNLRIHHQSSFQGGDGYRMFGNQELATSTIFSLFLVENFPSGKELEPDEFYSNTDFSLDMFLALKAWHENLFSNPNYGLTLDIFGANLLPTTGSRPVKRVVQNGAGRSDPSKMRAIPHNAILQQLGFLGNVISGFGSAANIDKDLFVSLYKTSPRLRQLCQHVLTAKQIGSLNTLLAYAKLLDNGFWIDRAYHGYQPSNMDAYRQIGLRLVNDPRANAVRNIVWIFRDDLMNLYDLSKLVGVNDVRVSGEERVGLDVLHALRIALIIDSLALICRVPNFSDSNRHNNEDVLRAALALDFEEVENIIRQEFSLNKVQTKFDALAETQDYDDGASTDYNVIEKQILVPFRENRKTIMLISQMVSGHYGAHG
jgi:phosphoenolpyruvate carboxylase